MGEGALGVMAFDTLDAFWAMGGHGPYVWVSYGVWFITIGALLLQSVVVRRRFYARLRQFYEERDALSGDAVGYDAPAGEMCGTNRVNDE